jgi:dipeptidyl aminopeptidase/acylaminoacyl peptidase
MTLARLKLNPFDGNLLMALRLREFLPILKDIKKERSPLIVSIHGGPSGVESQYFIGSTLRLAHILQLFLLLKGMQL